MKVLHLSTNGRRGGAGVAAWRLHSGLLEAGVDSSVLGMQGDDPAGGLLQLPLPGPGGDARATAFRALFVSANRTPVSTTWFGAELEGYDLCNHPAVREANILHLHWVSGMLSSPHIAKLLRFGKPVVWTLHDMAPFTGGCHYSAGCDGFSRGCPSCPQLRAFSTSLPSAQLADKHRLWNAGHLGLIALNTWMENLIRHAPLFSTCPTVIVRNGIDLTQYNPSHRSKARQQLCIGPRTTAYLFVADSLDDIRKGASVLAKALAQMALEPSVRSAMKRGEIMFFCVGRGEMPHTDIPVRALGWGDDAQLAVYYSAADFFILPSLEDNAPNTVLEALASGTPVIGFPVGGVPELVQPGKTGELLAECTAAALADTLTRSIAHPDTRGALRRSCRDFAEQYFDARANAKQVCQFYEHMLAVKSPPMPEEVPVFPGPELTRFLSHPNPESFGLAPRDFLQGGSFEPPPASDALKNERNLLQAQLADLQQNFAAAETDRLARGEAIEKQGREQALLHQEIDLRLTELHELQTSAESLRNERNLLQAQLADLQQNFATAETDRLARGEVIEQQGLKSAELHRLVWLTEQNRDWWKTEAEQKSQEAAETRCSLQMRIGALEQALTGRAEELAASHHELQEHLRSLETLRSRWWFRLAHRLGLH